VAPGRYRGGFPVPREGRYYVSLSGAGAGVQVGPETFGLAVPYSSEYIDLGVDERHLEELAATTGGRMLPLSPASLPLITRADAGADVHGVLIWWPFLLAGLVALVLEVVVRKIGLPEPWLRYWHRFRNRRAPAAESEPDPGYEELQASMARARARHIAAVRGEVFFESDDPAVRARLYLGRSRSGRR
jgi:hypothetical protein